MASFMARSSYSGGSLEPAALDAEAALVLARPDRDPLPEGRRPGDVGLLLRTLDEQVHLERLAGRRERAAELAAEDPGLAPVGRRPDDEERAAPRVAGGGRRLVRARTRPERRDPP